MLSRSPQTPLPPTGSRRWAPTSMPSSDFATLGRRQPRRWPSVPAQRRCTWRCSWPASRPGDEVLVSTLTFSASVNPIAYLGARPVFIDSERCSWNMDPALLAARRGTQGEAGPAAQGRRAGPSLRPERRSGPDSGACERYDIPLIEDAAEALGATYKGRAPGTFGKAGIFSFNGNKIITTSGGGMLVSDDADLIAHARKLATQARDPAPHYQHSEIGYNYRMSNVLAAHRTRPVAGAGGIG